MGDSRDFYGGSFSFIVKLLNIRLKSSNIFVSRDFHYGMPRIEIYKNDILIDSFDPYIKPDVDSIETEEDELQLHRQAFVEMVANLIESKYVGKEEDCKT